MINGEYKHVSEAIADNLPDDAPFSEEYYSSESEKMEKEDLSAKSNSNINTIIAILISQVLFFRF